MSSYLIERLAMAVGIDLRMGQLLRLDDGTAKVELGKIQRHIAVFRAFAYIGMEPRTTFVKNCCTLDPADSGYVQADSNFQANDQGLFVAGDVRRGSFKRVSAAVGEGAIVASKVWDFIYNRKD